MKAKRVRSKCTVTDRTVDPDVLTYTVGEDPVLDLELAKWDCMGTAAHVTMLSELKGLRRPIVTKAEAAKVRRELAKVVELSEAGKFTIREDDQDVHMAVERMLTESLGDLGKKIHTGRSRNDQVAVDVRLHMKSEILAVEREVSDLAAALAQLGFAAGTVPLVGRTHLQPAMPSTVEMWATGHAEMVLDQIENLEAAYRLADLNPLGSAAGYGVPLPLVRARTTALLGFSRTLHNCFGASMARGECEASLLSALAQLMCVLSRLAEDLILFSMPEFAYFRLPRRLHPRRVRDRRRAPQGRRRHPLARRLPRSARPPGAARHRGLRRGGKGQAPRRHLSRHRPQPLPPAHRVRAQVRRIARRRARKAPPRADEVKSRRWQEAAAPGLQLPVVACFRHQEASRAKRQGES